MSESESEQTARSVALEQAYVHEVYEQCAEKTEQNRHWPRIYKFLQELEPGALVCDIGCGNGKYLSVNNGIFKIGADRSKRLTDIARSKKNEVLLCDNLALPFRDESFDAVLSIAVVHHFASTERRVNALKELARVLRIGGKLVISVWAMEQKHRKFESQDVLVPWPKSYCLNPACNCITGVPCMKDFKRNHPQKCILRSKKNDKRNSKTKSHWDDPMFSPSPSTSSLSSPNETCYSFFRRALQKLAGGKKSGNRPWFLESFQNGNNKNVLDQCEGDDCTDIDDIPIELRRLENENITIINNNNNINNKPNDNLSIKSKSLGNILEIKRLDLVRSRSSIPGLCSTDLTSISSEFELNDDKKSLNGSIINNNNNKPKLIKQKSHFVDDIDLEVSDNTAIKDLINDLPEFQVNTRLGMIGKRRGNVRKQSSMNEEIMSRERLIEREHVRRNIMKQASLNEDIIYQHRRFDNIKDSLSSGTASKKFQLLKSGLTNKIKQSTTTSMEKVASISIKNGFVKILQSWKSTDDDKTTDNHIKSKIDNTISTTIINNNYNNNSINKCNSKNEFEQIERRLSKEDGSDSSKDSSLQSDTSVDSEDSFASVIYIPKKTTTTNELNDINTTTPTGYQLKTTSAPPSPRIKHPPDLNTPKFKLITISPLLKQFPTTSKSLPPPSPPGLSPRIFNNNKPFFSTDQSLNITKTIDIDNDFNEATNKIIQNVSIEIQDKINQLTNSKLIDKPNKFNIKQDKINKVDDNNKSESSININNSSSNSSSSNCCYNNNKKTLLRESSVGGVGYKKITDTLDDDDNNLSQDSAPLLINSQLSDKSMNDLSITTDDDITRKSRLDQIKELLKQKPGFASRHSKPSFPLVRRASTATTGRLETVAKTLPRLLSLELFNPETDDLDSDSSGVSSPDSVDSVISVISDERYLLKKVSENKKTEECKDKLTTETNSDHKNLLQTDDSPLENLSPTNTVILKKSLDKYDDKDNLIDLTEKLSENLMNDIDQYCKKSTLELSKDIDVINSKKRTSLDFITSKSSSSSLAQAEVINHSNCKYNELIDNTLAWLRGSTESHNKEYKKHLLDDTREEFLEDDINDNDDDDVIKEEEEVEEEEEEDDSELYRSNSDETMGFVMVSKTGEVEENVKNSEEQSNNYSSNSSNSSNDNSNDYIKFEESRSNKNTKKVSTKVITSATEMSTKSLLLNKNLNEKRQYEFNKKSQSDDISDDNNIHLNINEQFSESSSQESLPSDRGDDANGVDGIGDDNGGGGSITYHQYYHVFKEGELDQLINKYVENLHIISSYYDHANWCIVAEKVQVWTI